MIHCFTVTICTAVSYEGLPGLYAYIVKLMFFRCKNENKSNSEELKRKQTAD